MGGILVKIDDIPKDYDCYLVYVVSEWNLEHDRYFVNRWQTISDKVGKNCFFALVNDIHDKEGNRIKFTENERVQKLYLMQKHPTEITKDDKIISINIERFTERDLTYFMMVFTELINTKEFRKADLLVKKTSLTRVLSKLPYGSIISLVTGLS